MIDENIIKDNIVAEKVAKSSKKVAKVEPVVDTAAEAQAKAAANAALKAAIDANTEMSAREAEKVYVAEKKKHMLERCKNDEVVTRTISKLYAPILGKVYSYYYNGIAITVYCDGKPHKYPKFVAENIDRKLNKISESNTYKEVIEDRQSQDSF
jgi:hypothetical protein